jgi:hypothetical protein
MCVYYYTHACIRVCVCVWVCLCVHVYVCEQRGEGLDSWTSNPGSIPTWILLLWPWASHGPRYPYSYMCRIETSAWEGKDNNAKSDGVKSVLWTSANNTPVVLSSCHFQQNQEPGCTGHPKHFSIILKARAPCMPNKNQMSGNNS